jgi:hypothetical protein
MDLLIDLLQDHSHARPSTRSSGRRPSRKSLILDLSSFMSRIESLVHSLCIDGSPHTVTIKALKTVENKINKEHSFCKIILVGDTVLDVGRPLNISKY